MLENRVFFFFNKLDIDKKMASVGKMSVFRSPCRQGDDKQRSATAGAQSGRRLCLAPTRHSGA